MFDVIIAGAGPSGLYAARCCEKAGLSVLVLEEHARIGNPCHCSGLISKNLDMFIRPDKIWIEHEVKGAIIHSPNRKKLKVKKPHPVAYVVNRTKFDQFLASKVKSEIKLKSGIESFNVTDNGVVVKSGSKTFKSKVLLGCDGSDSFVRKSMNVKPKETLNGIIAIIDEKNTSEFVELWFDKNVCDGFLWKIPRGKTTEYGMLGTVVKFSQLESFFKLKTQYKKYAGLIPLGPPKTYFNRVMLVGDAAAHVKPWSCGGVIYSLITAQIAAEVVKQAKEANNFSEKFLKKYEQEWKRKIGSRIKAGMIARRVFKKMNNAQINLAISSAKGLGFLMNKLDMDFLFKMKKKY